MQLLTKDHIYLVILSKIEFMHSLSIRAFLLWLSIHLAFAFALMLELMPLCETTWTGVKPTMHAWFSQTFN